MINKKKRRRELLAQGRDFLDVKIAVLCGASPGELPDFLELFLLENGIRPEFFVGGYNRYYEDALFSEALLDFAPEMIYLYTTRHNIAARPDISDSAGAALEALEAEAARWRGFWDALRERFGCLVISNNFDPSPERPLGNLGGVDPRGAQSFTNALNAHAARYAAETPGFLLLDIAYLAARAGLSGWYDPTYMHLYKYAVAPPAVPALAKSLSAMISSAYGKRKKCLVLDLDDTLWGGVIGEVGYEHIKLGSETPEGESFLNFQRYVKELARAGVLLCVASKNDEAAAKSGFLSRASALSEEDFVCFFANWGPKHESIRKMAGELNLGLDSFVFLDDNPAERVLVRNMLPEVAVPEASRPEEFIRALEDGGYFEAVALSEEDGRRTRMYRQRRDRQLARESFASYDDYLKSLEMRCTFSPLGGGNIARASQLIEKTNQFNLTARRFTQAELARLLEEGDCLAFCARLEDKFGDNGIVTVLVGRAGGGTLRILSWVMSCRVFSRGLEYAVFGELRRLCAEARIEKIEGEYVQTAKNKPCAGLFGELGFLRLGGDEERSLWEYDLARGGARAGAVMEITHE